MYRVILIILIILISLLAGACATSASKIEQLETSVCGVFKEPFVFWLWNRTAGLPDPKNEEKIRNAIAVSHQTSDGRVLKGYRLESTANDGVKRGSVLVAQGNAMLADRLLGAFSELTDAGLEIYIFDYRGYGLSGGSRRLKAIVSDYRELFENVVPLGSGKRYLYGISFGGIIVSNVIGSGTIFDRAIVDSSPSRLSPYGCPIKYDPAENIPKDASRIFVLAGENDNVVRPSDSEELRTLVQQRGGKTLLNPDFAHPFMDRAKAVHLERMKLVRNHLIDSSDLTTSNGR